MSRQNLGTYFHPADGTYRNNSSSNRVNNNNYGINGSISSGSRFCGSQKVVVAAIHKMKSEAFLI